MPYTYKMGRLPATRPAALKDLSVYATGPLPTPPSSVAVPTAQYPIDGNSTYGDCTMAGVAHLIAAWNADVHQADPVPLEAAVVAEYFNLTGGADSGLNEAEVLKTWQTKGLFGEMIAGYAPVEPKDTLALHQATAFYGGVYLGIECPASAQEQFSNNEPWTYVEGSEVEGGHCIVALGYDSQGSLLCATWGGIATVTASFTSHFLDEAWVILPQQMVQAGGDSLGLDLEALQADLAKV